MMMYFTILSILFLLIIPTTVTLHMSCYSNASLILPVDTIFYNNLTYQSCTCLMIQQNISGFQYDSNQQSCYTFGNNASRTNLRLKINSQVCFVNRTSTTYAGSTSASVVFPPPPISTSTSISSSSYYLQESIKLTNNVTLTSLSIIVTIPKTFGLYNPSSYANFWSNTVANVINNTNATVMFMFNLINGQTIISGQWKIDVEFYLNGQVRPTSNDTYTIQIGSYQTIYGHF